jgi:putative addiction module killer protein
MREEETYISRFVACITSIFHDGKGTLAFADQHVHFWVYEEVSCWRQEYYLFSYLPMSAFGHCERSAMAASDSRLRSFVQAQCTAHVALKASRGFVRRSKSFGGGLYEFRIHQGLGWRLYYVHHGAEVIVLLVGGAKNSQGDDIELARRLRRLPSAPDHIAM